MKTWGVWIASAAILAASAARADGEGEPVVIHEKYAVRTDVPLTIHLDVTAGELLVEKSVQIGEATVSIEHTEGRYKSRLDFNEKKNRLDLRLSKRGGWHHSQRDDSSDRHEDLARIVLGLPESAVLYLETRLKAGETEMRLGGLRIKEADLNLWAGELDVSFDEPNLIPMDYLEIEAKVGEMDLRNLGNARAAETDINGGIGELRADFSGTGAPDSRTRIDLDIGETTVVLPAGPAVRVSVGGMFSFMSEKRIDSSLTRRGRFYYSEGYDKADSHCTFFITPGLGQLDIRREP
jgi:hypothetical protein